MGDGSGAKQVARPQVAAADSVVSHHLRQGPVPVGGRSALDLVMSGNVEAATLQRTATAGIVPGAQVQAFTALDWSTQRKSRGSEITYRWRKLVRVTVAVLLLPCGVIATSNWTS